MNLLDELTALELRLLTPEVRANPELLGALLSDDFIEVGASGRRFNKAQIIKDVLQQDSGGKFTAKDFELKRLATDMAMLLYTGCCETQGVCHYSRRCSIWQRQQGQWQVLYHQGTLCPDVGA